ncbi:MAG: M1 family aminopeptidase [Vicinamibacterales bacterium]|nr:M1 family aminopeptidase [Vicinamibacterales bacterium]
MGARAGAAAVLVGVPQDDLTAAAAGSPLDAGISLALARERSATISAVTYDLTLHIPEDAGQPVTGETTIGFALTAPASVVLDFAHPEARLRAVTANGRPVNAERVHNHFVIEAAHTNAGRNVVHCAFTAGGEALHRRGDLLYTLFVPAKAHTAFPCFDQPDLKARVRLTLNRPAGWEALANGQEVERQGSGDRVVVRFAETAPISTYLMAFAAGPLGVETVAAGDRTFRVFHQEPDAALVAANLPDVAELHLKALAWLEGYTGIPYPFGRFDMLLVPSFQFGGMEHPGAVFYQQDSLLLPASATDEERRTRAHLIAHETAHMWFGDLVTMRWFDDVWLKEVFANLMAEKILAGDWPDDGAALRFYLAHYPAAYDVDRTGGAHPIRQHLENLDRAGEIYGPIVYQKSPIAFRELESRMGAEPFRHAVRQYLGEWKWRTASWPDLLVCCEAACGASLGAWSRQWFDTAGRPEIVPVNRRWPATSYGHVRLDADTRAYLLDHLNETCDGDGRAAAWLALWESVADGVLGPGVYLKAVLGSLGTESEPPLVAHLLGSLRRVFWRWLRPAARAVVATVVEQACCEGLARSADAPQARMWLAAARDLTTTREGIRWLRAVWSGRESTAAGALSEPDQIALAETLAVLEGEAAESVLHEQLARTTSPERRARLEYLLPALSSTPASREGMLTRLRSAELRRPEAWALDAIGYLHHPMREDHAVSLLRPSLELLLDVHRTGDIFLPRRWAHATLRGHSSRAAAETVQACLATLPLSSHLRRLVLEAADDLLRVTSSDSCKTGRRGL